MSTIRFFALPLALVLACTASAQAASDAFDLTVLGTTDVHGHIYPTNYYGDAGDEPVGLARAHTLIRRLRRERPHTLLVDSGDCLQGTPLTYHNARVDTRPANPMVAAMNFMGYDAFAVGNHEYNYGLPYLQKARQEARYPFLSGNIFKHGTNERVYAPYVIKEVNGARVAILGFTTPGVAVWDRRHVSGKQDFRDILKEARRLVPEVKAKGADAVVVIIHSGLGGPYDATFSGYSASEGLPEENVCARLAEENPEVDAILLGHSHKDLPKLVVNGVLLAQAKKWGERLAVVDLHLEKQSGRWKVTRKDSETLDTARVTPDPGVLEVARAAHARTMAYVNSVVGVASGEFSAARARTEDTAIVDLINEVQRDRMDAQLSAASVFNAEARLAKGPVSVAALAGLYVYENTLTKVELTGRQLREYLEHSARYFAPYAPGKRAFDPEKPSYNYDMVAGVDYAIDVRRPAGDRIVGLRYRGKPVAAGDRFTMAVNSYRQNGGGGFTMLKGAALKDVAHTEIRELIIDYVKAKKTIDPAKVHVKNWRLLPENAIAEDGLHYR